MQYNDISKNGNKFPKVLVISFNSFLSSNANGRTLMNLFDLWDPNCLAQFYMSSDVPDFKNCKRYFRVTDDEAMKALFGKKVGMEISPCQKTDMSKSKLYDKTKSKRQNQMIRYIRQLVWRVGAWESKRFYKWIEDFKPDIIVLFAGNNAFVEKIALKIAKKYSLPIVLYNCEDYYLKPPKNKTIWARINKRYCDKSFEKIMSIAKCVIYNSKKLQNSYNQHFKHNSYVFMNPANEFEDNSKKEKENVVSYLGNVAVGREETLSEIADVLQRLGYRLNVYGNLATDEAKQIILNHKNIDYKGVVTYDECCNVMQKSKLLIHCESFDEKRKVDLRHAFSTKIADSLNCGTCFFVYAPADIAIGEYLEETKAAFFVSKKEELEEKLKIALEDDEERTRCLNKAKEVAKENHSKINTAKAFNKIIKGMI